MKLEDIFEMVQSYQTIEVEFETGDALTTNTNSMQEFIEHHTNLLSEHIAINDGSQVILKHQDYDFQVQTDAVGGGDFCTHRINFRKVDAS